MTVFFLHIVRFGLPVFFFYPRPPPQLFSAMKNNYCLALLPVDVKLHVCSYFDYQEVWVWARCSWEHYRFISSTPLYLRPEIQKLSQTLFYSTANFIPCNLPAFHISIPGKMILSSFRTLIEISYNGKLPQKHFHVQKHPHGYFSEKKGAVLLAFDEAYSYYLIVEKPIPTAQSYYILQFHKETKYEKKLFILKNKDPETYMDLVPLSIHDGCFFFIKGHSTLLVVKIHQVLSQFGTINEKNKNDNNNAVLVYKEYDVCQCNQFTFIKCATQKDFLVYNIRMNQLEFYSLPHFKEEIETKKNKKRKREGNPSVPLWIFNLTLPKKKRKY